MWMTVRGRRVFATSTGNPTGKPVILIHGAGGDHSVWADCRVGPDYRLLALDLPGHGGSDGEELTGIADLADWLTEVLDATGWDQAVLVGHSMGALAALDCAARHPGRVRSLVLLGCAAVMPVHPDLLKTARDDPAAAAALIAKWGFAKEPPPAPALVSAAASLMAACPDGVLHADLAACDAYGDGKAAAARLQCPVTVVIGGRDRMSPPEAGQALAAAIPGGRAVTIAAAGHLMMTEHPRPVGAALSSALDEAPHRGDLDLDLDLDLDPDDWKTFRAEAHDMLDDAIDHVRTIRDRPIWQALPAGIRAGFDAPLPRQGSDLGTVHDDFRRTIQAYGPGNIHPGFMGWVHGGGTVVGMLAEMLAGGLNANLGGRDHAPIEVERQILRWVRVLFGYPATASGLFVTGTSMANFLAVLVARTKALGTDIRRTGLNGRSGRLVAYASAAAHGCIRQAFELSGLGAETLRLVATDGAQRLDLAALREAVAADRAAGKIPFMVIGTAGSVDVGAIDDLNALADLAAAEGAWFHVDGAFGALGVLTPELAPLLAGLERSDSLALDFHKWGQVPYDAGYLLVRDGEMHRATFASPAAYLRRDTRGLAGGSPWPCDFGPDLSRGFRALKTWFTLRVYGLDRLGRAIAGTCRIARYLRDRVEAEERLELLAPVALNIVCFRLKGDDPDRLNAGIVADLHEAGIAVPSTTTIGGRLAIRAAIVNHRTREDDIDRMIDAILDLATKQ